jgi:hypothetical protein
MLLGEGILSSMLPIVCMEAAECGINSRLGDGKFSSMSSSTLSKLLEALGSDAAAGKGVKKRP